MKKLFLSGLVCVIFGLLSFLTPVTRTEPQTFQTGGIGISAPAMDRRPMPATLGAILIIGGLSMMVGGCREGHK
ncbi:MAG TPA: hypothetical protein VM912_18740 [Terriglobales bacterium]|nr:hypothetical protein [Terriglobales bacterium]